jgi:hypothetical protein
MMKYVLTAATALICTATAALAQQTPAAPAQATTTFDGGTPIESLVASPKAKPILLKYFPDIDKHPAYETFKSIGLRDLAPMSGGLITDEKLAAFEAELKSAK